MSRRTLSVRATSLGDADNAARSQVLGVEACSDRVDMNCRIRRL